MSNSKKNFNFNSTAAKEMLNSGATVGETHADNDITGESMIRTKASLRKMVKSEEPKKCVQINMPITLYKQLASAKIDFNMSLQEILMEGLQIWLEKNK